MFISELEYKLCYCDVHSIINVLHRAHIIFQFTLNFCFISHLRRHMSCSSAHLKRPAGGSWLWVEHQRELQLLSGLRALFPRHSHLRGQRYMEWWGAPVLAWVLYLSLILIKVCFNHAGACDSMHASSSFPESRNAYSALVLADGRNVMIRRWMTDCIIIEHICQKLRTSIDSVGRNGSVCIFRNIHTEWFRPLYRNNASTGEKIAVWRKCTSDLWRGFTIIFCHDSTSIIHQANHVYCATVDPRQSPAGIFSVPWIILVIVKHVIDYVSLQRSIALLTVVYPWTLAALDFPLLFLGYVWNSTATLPI